MLINCVLQLYYPEPNQVYTYRISVWIAYLVQSHLFEQPLKEPPSRDDGNFTNFILCNYYKLSSSSTAVGYSGCSYNAMQWYQQGQLMGVSYRVKSFSSQASRKSEWQPSGYSSAQVLTHLLHQGHRSSLGIEVATTLFIRYLNAISSFNIIQ